MSARNSLRGSQWGGRVLLIFVLTLAPAAVRGQEERPDTMPASLAEAVLQRLPESERYSKLVAFYERHRAVEGAAWEQSATGQKLLATLERLHTEAASASTATANQRVVAFTAGGRVLELGPAAADPDKVDTDEAYRWDTAGMIAGLILNRAASEGLLLPVPLTPDAQAAVNRGIAAAKAADYLQALRCFEEASTLAPAPRSPVIYFNLGLAESKLPGRELRAIAWFGAYLTAHPYSPAPNEAAVLEQMKALHAKNQSDLSGWLQSVQDAAGKGSAYDRKNNMFHMVIMRADAGDIAGAQRVAALIPNSEATSSFAYHEILKAQLKTGDLPGALKTIRIIEERLATAIALKEVATPSGYASARTNVALTLAEAQTELAEAQVRAGDLAGGKKYLAAAQRSAALIRYATYESIVQPAIAEALIKAGDPAGARAVIKAARITVDRNPESNAKINELLGIARAQLRAGDTTGAGQTFSFARDLAGPAGGSNFAAKMAAAQALGGDIPGSLATIGLIKDHSNIDQTLTVIAQAQAKTGDFEGASTTARKILWERGKSQVELTIAEAQGNHGRSVSDWLRILEDSNGSHVCALNHEFFTDFAGYLNSRRKLSASVGLADDYSHLSDMLRSMSEAKIEAHKAIGRMLNTLEKK